MFAISVCCFVFGQVAKEQHNILASLKLSGTLKTLRARESFLKYVCGHFWIHGAQ